jgi:NADH-quinone oxidoreductase subunit M
MTPWLSLLIFLPILGGLVLLVVPDRSPSFRRYWALAVSVVVFALNLAVLARFRDGTAAMQFVERTPWIPALHAYYHLGVDGISFPFILLTTLSTILVVLAGWRVIDRHQAAYFAAFLIMEGLMIGVFAALDALLFYLFWEAMLIPMFLIIGIWGGPRRIYATIKFFLYTFLGSVLMLLAILDLAHKTGTFDILAYQRTPLGWGTQIFVFLAFFAAFAVKVPMWPVHTWLPDAHVEAPTGGSVILAAILLKMGAYGFLRFSLPIAPDASRYFAFPMIVLSLIAIVYIAFVALVQDDMKKLVAYSSIAHMGFVTLGFFILFFLFLRPDIAHMGVEGGLFQMISHGFVSGALFLCVGVLYDRLHTRVAMRASATRGTRVPLSFLMVAFPDPKKIGE